MTKREEQARRYFEVMTELSHLLLETKELSEMFLQFPEIAAELIEIQEKVGSFRSLPTISVIKTEDTPISTPSPSRSDHSSESSFVMRGTSITGVATLRPQFIQIVPCI
jgi:hypothetical protein